MLRSFEQRALGEENVWKASAKATKKKDWTGSGACWEEKTTALPNKHYGKHCMAIEKKIQAFAFSRLTWTTAMRHYMTSFAVQGSMVW